MLTIKTRFCISNLGTHTCTYVVYVKSKKELNYDKFVDPNILGAVRLVDSDLRIHRISFFLLDIYQGIVQRMVNAWRLGIYTIKAFKRLYGLYNLLGKRDRHHGLVLVMVVSESIPVI